MNARFLNPSVVCVAGICLLASISSQGQPVFYTNYPTYIGNSLTVTNGASDSLPPFVILGEYQPSGPAATSLVTLPAGSVQSVEFFGQDYNFTLYALSLVSSGPFPDEQKFKVAASQSFSGTFSSPGVQTLAVSGFNVNPGEFVAFAGTGPWFPQNPEDAPGSDATYEDSTALNTFTATPPGGPGTVFSVGLHGDANATYDYVSAVFQNQGRTYSIGVNVTWSIVIGTEDFGYVPVGTTSTSSGYAWNGGSWNGTNLVMTTETFIGPEASEFSTSPNYAGQTLLYGDSYPFSITFDAKSAGYGSAILTNFEVPSPPFGAGNINLHGIGIPANRPGSGPIVPELAPLQVAMTNYLVTHEFEAGTLALLHDSKLVFRNGYGWRDTNFTTVIHPDNQFRLASVSKMLTGSAIAKLIGQGVISANTLVYSYLGIPPWGGTLGDSRIPTITIQELLDHAGGWNRDVSPVGDPPFDTIEISQQMGLDYPAAPTNVISWMFSKPLDFAPGTQTNYSNFGYQILGRVVEKASGKKYIDYIQQDLLGSAGVSNALGFLNVIQCHSKPADLGPWEIWDADIPYLDPLGQSAVDYPTPLQAQFAYGGGYYESFDSFGGLSASAIGLCNYLQNYWESSVQRVYNEYYGWYYIFYGSLPAATSVLYQEISQTPTTTNGLEFAALFNERDSDPNDNEEAEGAITNAANSITSWPTNGGGSIQWGASSVVAPNNIGSVTVNLVRTGLSTLPVDCSYTTYNTTADASNYVAQSGVVNFAANQTNVPITITVHNTGTNSTAAQFSLELISAAKGAWLGSQLSSVITIIPPPTLYIEKQSPDSVVLFWNNAGNYKLQTTASLSPTNWTIYGGTTTTSNGTNYATITPPSGTHYFRLFY